jgi:hypothetical protein
MAMKKENWLDDKARAPDPDDLSQDGLTGRADAAVAVGHESESSMTPDQAEFDASAPHLPPGAPGRIRVREA